MGSRGASAGTGKGMSYTGKDGQKYRLVESVIETGNGNSKIYYFIGENQELREGNRYLDKLPKGYSIDESNGVKPLVIKGELSAAKNAAKANGYKWGESSGWAYKTLPSGNTVYVDYLKSNGRYSVTVDKPTNGNSLEYLLDTKSFKTPEAAYKYAAKMAKKY